MEQIATNINKKNSRRRTGLGLSAVLMLAISCGSDTAPAPTEPTTPKTNKDAGAASAKKDASSSSAKKDAGSSSAADDMAADDMAADDTAADDNAAAAGDTAPSAADPASIARGKALATKCTACHGKDFSGAGYFPNITPDEDTGIGSWTDKQIGDSITKGLDDQGQELCALMQRYKLSDKEVTDMVAFLRSLPSIANEISMMCPD